MRRYPEIGPEFLRGIVGPAVLLLFCLAPHGVFPAIPLTRDAVSSYLAFSPLPALFSKNRRYLLCDTFRQRSLSRTPPAYSTRHAAVWCSDFPLANPATHQRPSAITNKLTSLRNAGKREVNQEARLEGYLISSRRRHGLVAITAIPSLKGEVALDRRNPATSETRAGFSGRSFPLPPSHRGPDGIADGPRQPWRRDIGGAPSGSLSPGR